MTPKRRERKCFEIMESIGFETFLSRCNKCPYFKEGLSVQVRILTDGRSFLHTRTPEQTEEEEIFCKIGGTFNMNTPDGKKWFISMVKISGISGNLPEKTKARLGVY